MNIIKILFKFLIYLYQLCISPYTTSNCKFVPSCSTYAINALTKLPLKVAIVYIIKRILKCNPFNKNDQLDCI
jgi:putative membrane protein insertion efficiency factor